mmetsp:Transcript_123044/g.200135  ORF Transcript_123044/g.200135 Transcript_123044/m.200135 type:complete len:174 (-) Transcript_123044:15-536(-)
MDPDAIADETFKQRLLLLARENDEQASGLAAPSSDTVSASATAAAGSSPALEDKLKDLLGALHREQPGDPLSVTEAAEVEASAKEALELAEAFSTATIVVEEPQRHPAASATTATDSSATQAASGGDLDSAILACVSALRSAGPLGLGPPPSTAAEAVPGESGPQSEASASRS